MKTMIVIFFFIFGISASAQTGKKDTVKLDSTQIEKIHKMPMDTTKHKMPVVPLTPQQNKKDTLGYLRRSQTQKKQPV